LIKIVGISYALLKVTYFYREIQHRNYVFC